MITFDIILPSIGRPSLFDAIDSVLQQQYKDWQLFVIVNGLDFKEADHIRYELNIPEDKRIRYFSTPNRFNDNGTWARNEGIALGDSPWIAYCDDDDIWKPHHLQSFVDCIHRHGIIRDDVNQIHTYGQAVKWRHKSPRYKDRKLVSLGGITKTPTTVSMCHERYLFNKTNGWRSADNHDLILWQEMLDNGGKPAILEEVTYNFLRGKKT